MANLKDTHTVQHILTSDGSSTLYAPAFNEHYHSIHGAIQESMHVFIRAGLDQFPAPDCHLAIWEMGFGTGLNALLTYIHAAGRSIHYTGIEAYPLDAAMLASLNYAQALEGSEAVYCQLCEAPWDLPLALSAHFTLLKRHIDLADYEPEQPFDLIYYDAFAPNAQPELWSDAVMERLYQWLRPGGVFVTYSAKSSVRRALLQAGFAVEKLPGPPGKREMLRARKG